MMSARLRHVKELVILAYFFTNSTLATFEKVPALGGGVFCSGVYCARYQDGEDG